MTDNAADVLSVGGSASFSASDGGITVASADPVMVNYATVDGIGALGAVAGDTAGEGDESFSVVLSNAVNATLDFNALK